MKLTSIVVTLVIILCLGIVSGCVETNPSKTLYNDTSKIAEQADSCTFIESIGTKENGDNILEIKYYGFYGMKTIWQINAESTGKISIKYDSVVKSGKFKLVLITPKNKVITIFEQSKQGNYDAILQKGQYRIKIVGKNAKGNIKMEVEPDDSVKTIRVDMIRTLREETNNVVGFS